MQLCLFVLYFQQYSLVLGAERGTLQQVRTTLERRPQRLPAPPLSDRCMVPR
jgi:hypothetical protein